MKRDDPNQILLAPLSELPLCKVSLSAPLRKFLDHLAEDPTAALRPRRRRTPKFCHSYFDACDAGALECERSALTQPEVVLAPARAAVELAERSGDRHLVHRSLGVLAHAHLAVEQTVEAFAVLESYRREALRCCRPCQADWWRRQGDYLVEVRDGAAAHRVLQRALSATEGVDEAGRVVFVHGISNHYLGHREAALEDALRVLERLDLSSPRGYFLDALAMIAVFLRGAGPEHDRLVLRRLARFSQRIRDVRDWTVVRIRLRWVRAQLQARLGDVDDAMRRLDGVRRYLLGNGPWTHALAVTLDLAVIYCRHGFVYGNNDRTVGSLLSACERRLAAATTEARLRDGVEKLVELLDDEPEKAFDALVALRSSFVVPVPGIVAERLGRGSGLVLVTSV